MNPRISLKEMSASSEGVAQARTPQYAYRILTKASCVIEKRHTLEGHASTYTDPDTGTTLDIKVIVFGHLEEVRNYFAHFDIPLKMVPTSLGAPDYVDFSTGETVAFNPPDQAAVGAAFQRYIAEILKYPKLQDGFEMVYPIPEDLLLPFGGFVKKPLSR